MTTNSRRTTTQSLILAMRRAGRALLPVSLHPKIRDWEKRWHCRLFWLRHGTRMSVLEDFSRRRSDLEEQLRPMYSSYVQDVTHPEAAVSLECAAFLLFLCELRRPRLIWDFGSGFSSVAFALYRKRSSQSVRILSCDHDPHWLGKTREFLDQQGLGAEVELVGDWNDLASRDPQPCADLILMDYIIPQRHAILEDFGPRLGPGTLLCLDDVHKNRTRLATEKFIASEHLRFVDLHRFTVDRYGRTQWLIFRPEAFRSALAMTESKS